MMSASLSNSLKIGFVTFAIYFSGLKPDTKYEVRLQAGTVVGWAIVFDRNWPWVAAETFNDDEEIGMYIYD